MAEKSEVTVFGEMIGIVYDDVSVNDDNDVVTLSSDEHSAKFYHDQDCCETVRIESIDGDLLNLIGSPITMAEIVSQDASGEVIATTDGYEYRRDSATWTFLKLATVKGYVTLRWLGESNGYYSESVSWNIDGMPKWGLEF